MANRDLVVRIIGDSRSFEKAFLRSETATKRFSRSVGGMVRTAALATGVLSGGFAGAALKAVRAASDLNEEINKTNVVFGRSAEAVLEWSKTTDTQLGISRAAALAAAGGFGQMLETAGLTERVASDFSRTLVGLAADMASFNNIDPSVALEKLRSGLAGEAEPLRTVGVLLSETRVKQEAYASGIAAVGAKLTEAQKVQARYNLILKDTGKQQGDFARTSDSLANVTRKLRAQFDNILAVLGSALLPTVTRITKAVSDWLAVEGNQERVQRAVTDAVRAFVTVVRDLRAAIGPVVEALGGFRRTLEILLTIMVAAKVARFTKAITGLNAALLVAGGRSKILATGLGRLKALGVITIGVNVLFNLIDKDTRSSIAKDAKEGRLGSALLKAVVGTDFGLGNIGQKPEYKSAESKAKAAAINAARKSARSILEGIGRQFETESFRVGIRPIKVPIPKFVPGTTGSAAGDVTTAATSVAAAAARRFDASQLNQFFDNKISRALDRVQDASGIPAQIRALQNISGLISERIARTKDVTRKLTLEDALLDVTRRIRDLREQASSEAESLFDGTIGRALDRVQDAPLKQQVAKLKRIGALISERIKATSDVLRKQELEDQLLAVNRAVADARERVAEAAAERLQKRRERLEAQFERRQGRQFRALGLAATGEDRVAGVRELQRALSQVSGAVEGSFLDTKKTQSVLGRIRRVLAGGLGTVTRDVRAKIREMLDGIRSDLKSHEGQMTKTSALNTKKVLAGLGLDPDEIRALRGRLSQFNSAGVGLAAARSGTVGAFGGVAVAGPTIVVQTPDVILDGQKVSSNVRRHNQIHARGNPLQKRGGRR